MFVKLFRFGGTKGFAYTASSQLQPKISNNFNLLEYISQSLLIPLFWYFNLNCSLVGWNPSRKHFSRMASIPSKTLVKAWPNRQNFYQGLINVQLTHLLSGLIQFSPHIAYRWSSHDFARDECSVPRESESGDLDSVYSYGLYRRIYGYSDKSEWQSSSTEMNGLGSDQYPRRKWRVLNQYQYEALSTSVGRAVDWNSISESHRVAKKKCIKNEGDGFEI